jgi:hypothetical protein
MAQKSKGEEYVIAANGRSLRREFLQAIRPNINIVEPRHEPDEFEFFTSQEFAAREEKIEFLIDEMLVASQPAVIGGLAKDCKTGLAVDLVVSLGTGKPFLGKFRLRTPRRAGIISIENGFAALQRTAKHICRSKGVSLAAANVDWCPRFPRLDSDSRLSRLSNYVRSRGLKVLVLDPLYLILGLRGEGVAPGDLFAMGDLLARAADVCLSAGCTPIFVHHFNRSSSYKRRKPTDPGRRLWDPPDLFDLSQAGPAEYFRQWVLVGRRRPFDPDIGLHELWLNVGGSAGFSGLWAVNILEGRLTSSSNDRRWDVTVRTRAKLIEDEQREKAEQKAGQRDDQLTADSGKVAHALLGELHGETKRWIRDHTKLPANRLNPAIDHLLMIEWIEETSVRKGGGTAGKRDYTGYRLSAEGRNGTAP